MERQTIVIQYVGENPAVSDVIVKAAVSAINTINDCGFYVDTTVNPIAHHFTETDIAQMTAMMANKTKSKGITIKVETPERPALSKEDREKFLDYMNAILNG